MLGKGQGRFRGGSVLAVAGMVIAAHESCANEWGSGTEERRAVAERWIAEVLVTARKREEAAHQIPISLSVRMGDQLERAHTIRLQEIAQSVPNLNVEILNPRQASIAIRGLGRNPANDGLEGSVGVFVDGVYLGRPGMAVVDHVDVERIEVLRGPQGTLFGKNTNAGLLSITTRAPTDAFETFAQATVGNHSYTQLHGALSGPLGNGVSARLSVFTTDRDGFVQNPLRNVDLGEFERNFVRAQLAWRPNDAFDARLIADYGDQDELGPGVVLIDPGINMEDGSIRPNNFLDRAARAGYAPQFDPFVRRNAADAPQRAAAENAGASVHMRWQFDDYALSSITAWRSWNYRPRADGDFTPLDIQRQLQFEVQDEQLTAEWRLTYDGNERFDYQLGVFLFGQSLESEFTAEYGVHAADFAQPGMGAAALDGFTARTLGTPETRSAAVFGHANWRLGERTTLSAGARWTTEEKEADIRRTSSGGATLEPTDANGRSWRDRLGGAVSASPRADEDFTSAHLSLSYQIHEDALAYVSASRGAKSGGLNISIVPAGIGQVIEPEVVTSYELGFKRRWRAFSLDLAAFEMDVGEYQATVRDPTRAATFLTNAGAARTRGIEFEAVYRVSEALSFTLAAGSADARFTSFRQAPCPPETVGRTTCDFTGSRVPGAPPWTADVGASYERTFGTSDYIAYVAADWFHVAAYQVELSSHTRVDAYDVANARIGLRAASRRWEAWLWARNLLNEDYYAALYAGGSFNSGLVYGLPADPRTYGVTLRVSY